MNRNQWIRAIHRWLSIAFTVAAIVNVVAMARGVTPSAWIGLMALFPLVVLVATGLYLFVLPYAAKAKGARLTD